MSWAPVRLLVGALMRGSKGRGGVVLLPAAVVAALAGVECVEPWQVVAMSQVPAAGPTWAATPSSRRTGLSSVFLGEGAGLALIHHILAVTVFGCLLEIRVGGKEETTRWVVVMRLSDLNVVSQCWTHGNGVVLVPLGNHTDGGSLREELDFRRGPRAFLCPLTFSRYAAGSVATTFLSSVTWSHSDMATLHFALVHGRGGQNQRRNQPGVMVQHVKCPLCGAGAIIIGGLMRLTCCMTSCQRRDARCKLRFRA
jgi:hypothetical protein